MFYNRFEALCEQKGVTPNRACLDMGLSRSIAAKWKNTGNNPRADVLAKIADYFGVTTSDLLGETVDKVDVFGAALEASRQTKKDPETLTGIEARLVDLLTQLTPSEEEKVQAFVEGLLANRTT